MPKQRRKSSGGGSRRFRHRSEAVRDRDISRALAAWRQIHAHGDAHTDISLPKTDAHDIRPSPDRTLSILAEATALKLRARGCFVSLCCRATEFVLADVALPIASQPGRVVSLTPEVTWLGYSSFSRELGLTGYALDAWQRARSAREPPPTEPPHYYSTQSSEHCYIFNDVYQHTPSKKSELIRRNPWIRFYGAVPIRNGQGSVIGALTVVDDQPRYGLSSSELTLMEDTADMVEEHLHATCVRSQQQLSERLLKGLSLFNAGGSSIREWWSLQQDAAAHSRGRNHLHTGVVRSRNDTADHEFGLEDAVAPRTNATPNEDASSRRQGSSERADSRALEEQSIASGTPADRSNRSLAEKGIPRQAASAPRESNSPSDKTTSDGNVYARAANIMREAMGIDGVIFINLDFATDVSSNDESAVEEDGPTSSEDDGQFCQVLGSSVRSSIRQKRRNGDVDALEVRKSQIKRLLERYPQGHVFHFESNGTVLTSSDDNEEFGSSTLPPSASLHARRQRSDVEALGGAVSNLQSLGIYPIRDNNTARWRSCIYAWSTSTDRIFDDHQDLAYLQTFGHSLIVELCRFESNLADQAKSRFIASISHEMRSPLHGILAGTELLSGTELTPFQQEMTNTVEAAGRTLLDTVDHILEHSKISSTTRATRARGVSGEGSQRPKAGPLVEGQATSLDLAALTESTVSICASSYMSQTQITTSIGLTSPNSEAPSSASAVAVILNINHRPSWTVKMVPGAWTRILTNLVGNALKYTSQGRVTVDLKVVEPFAGNSNLEGQSFVLLTVEDTGSGMSRAFVKNGAFIPFLQEDVRSPGVGLGLSIVKQIADSIGGSLRLSSDPGQGTKISLRLPVHFLEADDSSVSPPTNGDGHIRSAGRMELDCFHFLATTPSISKSDPTADETELALQQSVTAIAADWFSCSPAVVTSLPTAYEKRSTSVCILSYRTYRACTSDGTQASRSFLAELKARYACILLLAPSIQPLSDLHSSLETREIVHIAQPVGPARLLRAISDHGRTGALPAEGTRPDLLGKLPDAPAKINNTGRQAPIDNTSDVDSPSSPAAADNNSKSDCIPHRTSQKSERTMGGPDNAFGNGVYVPGNRDTVLLVEDNDVNMRILVAFMKKVQLPYDCAFNGREAVDMFRAKPSSYFLILMDMNMPIMDGFTATAQIRRLEERLAILPRVSITALTGVTDAASRHRAFQSGVDDFYSKPVRLREISAVLTRIRTGTPVTSPS